MSENTVTVELAGHSYEVMIEPGLIGRCGEELRKRSAARKVALVTDSTVADLYGLVVSASLTRAEFEVVDLAIDPGEQSKTWAMAGQIVDAIADHGLERTDLVVALGGGVVGDLAGFVAATYLRGVDFAQLPTTLLAMVDSSVGGKTGVDLAAGKNLAGAFKQPIAVLADTGLLESLPEAEWQSGLAEVAKSAIIDGEEFTSWLESNAAQLVSRQRDVVDEAVKRCVRFKAGVVAGDERESGPRECLNYGHTLGHAVEKVGNYGTYTHGAAVAEGMRFASRLSMDVAGAQASFVKRQDRLLNALGLTPIEGSFRAPVVLDAMRSDKKAREGVVRFVLADEPGSWRCEPVPEVTLTAHLEAWAATKVVEPETEQVETGETAAAEPADAAAQDSEPPTEEASEPVVEGESDA